MGFDVLSIVQMIGGLALFIYGMTTMGKGLERAAGSKLEKTLEKMTGNVVTALLMGMVVTMVIQSSSATTVMVVGFVNAGIMTLKQSVGVILGANIGTTITAQILRLSGGEGSGNLFMDLLKPKNLAYIIVLVGVIIMMLAKKRRTRDIADIFTGFGILFIGMSVMEGAVAPLADLPQFADLFAAISNPVLGVLVGAGVTAIIQSSSASVGILQALSTTGAITYSAAIPIILGQNIGTCITAVLASIGTSRVAKRTTIIHLLFNIIGTTLFTIICILTPFTTLVEGFTPNNVSAQIANMHTIFNITTTILLIPFGSYLAKLATRILPDLPEERDDVMHLEYIQPFIPIENRGETKIGISAIAITAIRNELIRMTQMTRENVGLSFDAVHDNNLALVEDVRNREEYIDYLNKEISKYISRMLFKERNPKDSQYMSALFKVCGNLERIGDHAMNICEYTNMIKEKQITFSKEVMVQIEQMKEVCCDALDLLLDNQANSESLHSIESIEQKIDDMTESFRKGQIDRMQTGKCSDEGCVLYSEMLTDFERIGDHILNIGQEVTGSVDD